MSAPRVVALCPGQGAQTVGMGRGWSDASAAARAVFDEADAVLGDALGAPLSSICFDGPADRLNETDVSQPAIYACSVASWRAIEAESPWTVVESAGLSLGEYTALHLAGVFDFATGLRLVATRGRLMQEAAVASEGGMVALIGASDEDAEALCRDAAEGDVLVAANFNAPGQIVLSGDLAATERAARLATERELRATPLTVAGAFHSPLMQPAADRMAEVLAEAPFARPTIPVWSNVTGDPHDPDDLELLRTRLVEQIVRPVRWSQSCAKMPAGGADGDEAGTIEFHELAPGSVLRGLMRRIDRQKKVTNHDQPSQD